MNAALNGGCEKIAAAFFITSKSLGPYYSHGNFQQQPMWLYKISKRLTTYKY